MHADAALSDEVRNRVYPKSRFDEQANLLVMPSQSAANISYNIVKVLGDCVPVGPMLVGTNKPEYILTDSASVHTMVNLAVIAEVDEQDRRNES